MNARTELEQLAERALRFIPTSGVDGIGGLTKQVLQNGLREGVITQEQVDSAQLQFREHSARNALGFVPTSGVDEISSRSKEDLQYGLNEGLFTQEDVDKAQRKYKASRVKR